MYSPITFTTSGALPTGLTAATVYWIIGNTVSGNTFNIATSAANALNGIAITTTGTQSGTHTGTSGTAMANATAVTVAGLLLTPGDWDLEGIPSFAGGGTTVVTYLAACLNVASPTMLTNPGFFSQIDGFGGTLFGTGFGIYALTLGLTRVNIATPTLYYMNVQGGITVSTAVAYGIMRARRAR